MDMEMEDRISKRIREDIQLVGTLARQDAADVRADIKQIGEIAREDIKELRQFIDEKWLAYEKFTDESSLDRAQITGRVKSLEEKMTWIMAAFGAVFAALMAFAWRVIAGGR